MKSIYRLGGWLGRLLRAHSPAERCRKRSYNVQLMQYWYVASIGFFSIAHSCGNNQTISRTSTSCSLIHMDRRGMARSSICFSRLDSHLAQLERALGFPVYFARLSGASTWRGQIGFKKNWNARDERRKRKLKTQNWSIIWLSIVRQVYVVNQFLYWNKSCLKEEKCCLQTEERN